MAKLDNLSLEKLFDGVSFEGKRPTVCVALSGGRDSVALLHCLKKIENYDSGCGNDIMSQNCAINALQINVSAVNIEHGIRGERSVEDSRFVASLCEEYGVPLHTFTVNAPAFAKENGYTLEQAARILRYRCFDELLNDGKCDFIALAHHLDDQIETVLMRILRGTGIRGLIGMKAASGRYIRPLLDYTREDIDEYIKQYKLEYVEDETNGDTAYTRNFLRQEIATLKQRFPSMGNSIKRLCDNAAEADSFIQSFVPEIEVKDGVSYVKTADCVNVTLAKRLFLNAAAALGVTQDIEDRHLSLILEFLNASSGKRLDLTHGLFVYKEGDRLAFTRQTGAAQIAEYKFAEGRYEELGVSVLPVDVEYARERLKGGEALYVDADKIPDGAVIRGFREGDYIRKFGGGTKNLGDFLTDKKTPLRVRDNLKILADGSRALAVFGVDISADVKIDESTKKVYELSLDGNL